MPPLPELLFYLRKKKLPLLAFGKKVASDPCLSS